MAKISKKTREEAALLCAVAASDPEPVHERRPQYLALEVELGVSEEAANLALEAWLIAYYAHFALWTQEVDAEAEALIRDGWEPEF